MKKSTSFLYDHSPPARRCRRVAQVISHASSCEVYWDSVDLNMTGNALLSTSRNTPWLVVRPSVLTPGQSYTFQIIATDNFGHSDQANMTVTANRPPYGHSFSVAPLEGRALSTKFSFACSNWFDPDGDSSLLNYRFAFTSTTIGEVVLFTGRNETGNRFVPVVARCTAIFTAL